MLIWVAVLIFSCTLYYQHTIIDALKGEIYRRDSIKDELLDYVRQLEEGRVTFVKSYEDFHRPLKSNWTYVVEEVLMTPSHLQPLEFGDGTAQIKIRGRLLKSLGDELWDPWSPSGPDEEKR